MNYISTTIYNEIEIENCRRDMPGLCTDRLQTLVAHSITNSISGEFPIPDLNEITISDGRATGGDGGSSGNPSHHSDASYERISEHYIVHEWKERIRAMSETLYSFFGREGLMDRLGIDPLFDPKKWDAACDMEENTGFHIFLTVSLSEDVKEYVTIRLAYIMKHLHDIQGPEEQLVKNDYIAAWVADIKDPWQWMSIIDKWRLQLAYMLEDLIEHFGGRLNLQQALGGAHNMENFEALTYMDDDYYYEELELRRKDGIEDFENVEQDNCTDVGLIVHVVQKTIREVIEYLEILEDDEVNRSYIQSNYKEPFIVALGNDTEWTKLIGVKPALTPVR